ncbi:MAG: DAK2 domain-containing protein [Oscillospiraceae bacterium]|nr:DAK2 domain-containing protein [Oscillospiraceae bacterium]
MITGEQLRDGIISGANNVTNLKSTVDALNVFPVPDGDTGTNMSMTIGAAVPELQKLPDSCTVEQAASVAASALLRGARGNSGVILSLLFRGFSRSLSGRSEASSRDLYQSLCKGVESAYKAVMKPTEGTILTVAREASEKAADVYESMEPVELWAFIVEQCKDTLARTPDMLPVLKKAGVVDSGGQGLVFIFEGMLEYFRTGKIIENKAEPKAAAAPAFDRGAYSGDTEFDAVNHYCTEFIVLKDANANYAKLRAYLESIGVSVVAVEDDEIIKCHVHTRNPGLALSEAVRHGQLSKVKIENMLEQNEELKKERAAAEKEAASDKDDPFPYAAPSADTKYGFVSVCSGEGIARLFGDLGVDRIVSGGQTMNPSTDDILKAIQSIPAQNVLVLANNKNIIMAAEQACKIADRNAVVVMSRTIPQGISAMIAFLPDATVEENLISMNAAADRVATGQITFAARDSDFDGHSIKQGEILALANGKLAFTEKDVGKAAVKLAKKLATKSTEFVTIIYGEGVSADEANAVADAVRKSLSGAELTLVDGGQPVYYYYISAE